MWDSHVQSIIEENLTSSWDFHSLILTCSHFYQNADFNKMKTKFARKVFEFEHQIYTGEHFELPNGTWHGKSVYYVHTDLGLVRQKCWFQDGRLNGSYEEWLYCGFDRPQSVFLHQNYYFPLIRGHYTQGQPSGTWTQYRQGLVQRTVKFS